MNKPDHADKQPQLVLLSGGVWKLPPVSEEPRATLQRWQVFQLVDGSRHLVGYCMENREGRTTNRVVDFNPAQRTCRTRSGRLYELVGESGVSGDAMYVWGRWCDMNKVDHAECVTAEFEEAMRQAANRKDGEAK